MNGKWGIVVRVIGLAVLVVAASIGMTYLWNPKPETVPPPKPLVLEPGMTVETFGRTNDLANPVLKELFGLSEAKDLSRPLDSFHLSNDEIIRRAQKAMALAAEESSKNWMKILAKFILWLGFLAYVFRLTRTGRITPGVRKGLYFTAAVVFGVVLGSDPSAMGTVKDAIHLFAVQQVIFPPRLIALSVFLLTVLLANKYICAWGCQAGVLQDLVFRLGRNHKDDRGRIPQYKPPFWLTNTIRVVFLAVFIAAAVLWGVDIIEPVDPFKIYKPLALSAAGMGFIGVLAAASLFVYRPWCHFFCPFGLVGWLVEKVSVFKVKVDYGACVACEACARACPSTVMGAILKQDRTIPDCFSCATCMNVCPTKSITFSAGKRVKPPEGHFGKKRKNEVKTEG
jgi:Pyruvate/2-oxoacid:ferredoxin oxidoreductase delta subunit